MPKNKSQSPTKSSRPTPLHLPTQQQQQQQRPVVKIPHSSTDASSNWKMLQSTLESSVNPNARFENRRKAMTAAAAAGPTSSLTSYSGASTESGALSTNLNVVNHQTSHLTEVVAIDCEMVGVGPSNESVLARVSVINKYGCCVFDKYVKPKVPVTDYRTSVSGIREEDLRHAQGLETVACEVAAMLHGRIVVGHAIHHDFKALLFGHPRFMIRDTSKYFKKFNNGKTPSLKNLALRYLNINIQSGEHSSVEDAQAVMKIYLLHRVAWEHSLKK